MKPGDIDAEATSRALAPLARVSAKAAAARRRPSPSSPRPSAAPRGGLCAVLARRSLDRRGCLAVWAACVSWSSLHCGPREPVAAPSALPGGAAHAAPGRVLADPLPPVPRFSDPARVEGIRARAEQQRAELEAALAALPAPGFAWGLVVDGQLLVSGAGGKTGLGEADPQVTPQTVFRVGSITKVFTALAALRLRDAGQLALDDPAEALLPELAALQYPTRDSAPFTVRQLMTHSAGLPRLGGFEYAGPGPGPTEAVILESLKRTRLEYAPGSDRVYSNLGGALLGLLVARASGQRYRDYVTEHVLAPLGMRSSGWDAGGFSEAQLARPHQRNAGGQLERVPEWVLGDAEGMGGLYSTLEDLARFAAFELGAWPPSNAEESPVLRRATLRESQQPQHARRLSVREQPGGGTSASVAGNGLGWSLLQTCRFAQLVWHNGGTEGHSAWLALLPRRGVGVILLANGQVFGELDAAGLRFLERLDEAQVLPERETPPTFPQALRARVEQVLGSAGSFDEAAYGRLFDARYRAAIPLASFNAGLAELRDAAGACELGEPWATHHPIWQGITLRCERGEPRVLEAALRGEQLSGLGIRSLDEARARAAEHRQRERPSACPPPSGAPAPPAAPARSPSGGAAR